MSARTSATGGYLTPASKPSPLEDDDLEDFLQEMVAGITGLSATMVRPRWQPIPPKQPSSETDWAAVGIVHREPDDNAVQIHNSAGEGSTTLSRHEVVSVTASFYGPNSHRYAGILRDGLSIAQNREPLQLRDMGLVDVGAVVSVPSLVQQRWIRGADLTIRVRREITREYAILNLNSAQGAINGDPWEVEK
ncbi:phage neck terminator protein [Pseudochelatococcus contaminans]|uniref:Phage neck terminator protein gp12-like domain-containing protein n=1 Tax=Pseudochelatococcus contaminans TaxID=1538103 RepID=A0A7W5Z2Q7_9HYPH|nr:hypothetical protein [Pseudochelatococcus contaminans]MBB3808755.1 hypothetical protein [Pseudochelatococcus contaminans]